MNNKEVANLIAQIARIRNVDITYVCETLRTSIVAGLKRRFGTGTEAEVSISPDTGEIKVFLLKKVVEKVNNPGQEIALEEAQNIIPES
ncbi:MAG: NusA N-terminal domain-containing protein, partial [candidate division WOR-3 bacterium]